MDNEIKKWKVEYNHEDGRSGTVVVSTEIQKSAGFQYGNGKAGALTIGSFIQGYDLRYNSGDLHKVMLNDYFGKGLVKAEEI